uniref:G-protein coupled receptors family 1 profile domain-containing protein n=1 Tax=Leptobrachium leishanense TaxID=445787 RepID=A0A8C5QPX5_9ANUR
MQGKPAAIPPKTCRNCRKTHAGKIQGAAYHSSEQPLEKVDKLANGGKKKGSIEVVLLSFMAYDRYVAICNPLQYHLVMNTKKCALILAGTWIPGCLNSCLVTILAANLSFCRANEIQQFFCNVKAIAQVACASREFEVMIYIEVFCLGLCPLLLSFTSYVKIIQIILRIKSTLGRKKAFSTCTSHLMVLILFYGTILFMYMRPTSQYADELDQVFSVLYAAVAPMLNPLIYSLRNKEVKSALIRIIGPKKQLV